MIIPKGLKNDDINFVLLKKKNKIPIERGWQEKKLKHDNPVLLNHIKNGGNYGVMGGGDQNLIIVDFDNEKVQEDCIKKLPKTFTVKTGSGLLHKYFLSDKVDSFKVFAENLDTIADVQGRGKQVVGPGSIHPNGNAYDIVDDSAIALIEYSELKALLMSYDSKPKKEESLPKGDYSSDFLEEIKQNIKLDKVLSMFGVDTSGNPTNCPLHDSKGGKCLGFNDNTAHCFHCDGSWNIFSFVMQMKKCDFNNALEFLAGECGLNDKLMQSRVDYFETQYKENDENVNKEEEKMFEVIWDKDLEDYDNEDQDWLIENYIPSKAVGVWTGKRGTFKTFLVLKAAMEVSMGKKFLGKYETKKSKVLYLDKENGVQIIKERTKLLKSGMKCDEDQDIGYICFSQLKLDKNTDHWAIEEVIEKEGINLLVVDTYRRAIGYDENSAGDVSRLFVDILRPMVEKHNLSIILIHHDRKGSREGTTDEMDEIRGSSDLANYCDFILKNERKGKNQIILKQLKCRRAIEQEPIQISIRGTDDALNFISDGVYEKQTTEMKATALMLKWFEENNLIKFATSSAKKYLEEHGIAKQKFYDTMKDMANNGLIISEGRGSYSIAQE